jgi:hypothetical protein
MRPGRRTPDRRTIATLAVATVALVVLWPAAARAATCGYQGLSGGAWETATNWDCGHVPTASDAAEVLGSDNVVVNAATDVAGTLQVDTGGTLAFVSPGKLTVSGATTFGAATLSGAGTLVPHSFDKAGTGQLTLDQGAKVSPTADSTWTDGAICIQNAAVLDLAAYGSRRRAR